eukprot:scaffold8534_cov79-Skeletonema_dohrnii-CCMP3373.AAC.2
MASFETSYGLELKKVAVNAAWSEIILHFTFHFHCCKILNDSILSSTLHLYQACWLMMLCFLSFFDMLLRAVDSHLVYVLAPAFFGLSGGRLFTYWY